MNENELHFGYKLIMNYIGKNDSKKKNNNFF